MSTPDFFARTWTIKDSSGANNAAAYPIDQKIRIGAYGGSFMVAWSDNERVHVLVDLALENGVLTSESAVELGTPNRWMVRIEEGRSNQGNLRIEGRVSLLSPGGGETNLSGNWGAEAPPNDPPARRRPRQPAGTRS